MKKLDIYYHCKPKGQENGFFSVEDVLSADDIKYPKFFIPVQIDVVKTEISEGLDGEEITSTSTMKYTIGSLEQTAKVLTEIKEDEGRIVKTPYRTKMLTDAKVHASNALKEQILSTNPVLYKDYLYPQVAVFKTPTGDKQVYAKSSSVKVFSTLSALKMAFIGDTIDYLGSNNKTETPAKTYTKNTKYKGHFDNNSNK